MRYICLEYVVINHIFEPSSTRCRSNAYCQEGNNVNPACVKLALLSFVFARRCARTEYWSVVTGLTTASTIEPSMEIARSYSPAPAPCCTFPAESYT